MPAIGRHETPTVEREWDGPAAVAAAPNEAEVLRYMHAWRDPDEDPDQKDAWKLPHHGPRRGAAAVLPGVRNALARLPQTQGLSGAERSGAETHLRGHLADAED